MKRVIIVQARPAAFAAVVLLPVPAPPGGLGARSAMTDMSGQAVFDGLAAGGTFSARVENRRARFPAREAPSFARLERSDSVSEGATP